MSLSHWTIMDNAGILRNACKCPARELTGRYDQPLEDEIALILLDEEIGKCEIIRHKLSGGYSV